MKRYSGSWWMLVLLLGWGLLPAAGEAVELQWQNERGEMHSLAEYKGRPVLLHFWASWCGPCRHEMPLLTAWLKRHPDVLFIPVSLDDDLASAKRFLSEHGFDLPAQIGDSRQAMGLGARGLPTTMVISAAGDIAARQVGALPWNEEKFSNVVLGYLRPAAP